MASSTIISEAYLTIAVVIAASILSASFYSSLQRMVDVERERTLEFKREVETRVKILFAAPYNGTAVKVWIKNIGLSTINSQLIGERADLFFGPKGRFKYIPYSQPNPPTWRYSIKNDINGDGNWDPRETIEIIINEGSALNSGDYYVKYCAYTGASSEYTFTVR
ncbi:MAG: flagellin [Nitrososphaerales archaeon]|nr:flagellin [Nitrososphaerales archaeon]